MLRFAVIPILGIAIVFQSVSAPAQPKQPAQIDFNKQILPFLKKYCVSCHSGPNAKYGVDFGKFKTQADAATGGRIWKRANREVSGNKMPPAVAKAQPTEAERKMFSAWCAAQSK